MHRTGKWLALLCALGTLHGPTGTAATAASAVAPSLRAGQPLADALRALQDANFSLIYTSALVPEALRVQSVPERGDRESLARELLAPHGLTLQPVGPRLFAVVRATEPAVNTPRNSPEPTIAEVVIAASRYQLRDGALATSTALSGSQLGSRPGLGEDALRSVGSVPGIAQNSLSASSYVRGGDGDETLVLLDGFPIRQPFHLPGYQSLFGILDPALIANAEIYTGGFPARYGDRMSAVFDLTTRDGRVAPRRALGLSFFNASARVGGALPQTANDGGGGEWLAMARIGTLRPLINAIDPGVGLPSYGDAFARVQVDAGAMGQWTLNALFARDELDISDEDRGEQGLLESDAAYLWLNGRRRWSERLSGAAWLGFTRLGTDKDGTLAAAGAIGAVHDRRLTQLWDLRGRMNWTIDASRELEVGMEWSTGRAEYDYSSTVAYNPAVASLFGKPLSASRSTAPQPRRDDLAAFGAFRQKWRAWALEAGARARRISANHESTIQRLEPRLAIRRDVGANTALRFAWGQFHQQDGLEQLRIADGIDRFGAPQRSDHVIVGIEQQRESGISWRAEAFAKLQLEPRVRFENQLNTLTILPELAPDRVRIAPEHSELRGVELSLRQPGHPWSWWASYAWSQSFDELAGVEADVPRGWDQRHALSGGVDWQRGDWSGSALLNLHSGWPTSEIVRNATGATVLTARNSQRVAAYASLDLRGSWRHSFRPGTLTLSLEITNALDRGNACCNELVLSSSAVNPIATREINWLPLLPSLSLLWEF